jgi:hypothetical protein
MATRTITVHDRCTTEGCGKILFSISEGEGGICASCWVAKMPADTKQALKRIVAAALKISSKDEIEAAMDDAVAKLKRDDPAHWAK